jgi:hypothetical protein
VGFEAAHLAGGEVGDDDDASTDELFGGVPLGDAGEDLPLFVAEIDFEAEEFVGFGNAFADEDLSDAELDLGEVVDGDLGRGVGGLSGMLGGRSAGKDAGGMGVGVGWSAGALGGDSGGSSDVGAGVGFGEGRGAGAGGGVERKA